MMVPEHCTCTTRGERTRTQHRRRRRNRCGGANSTGGTGRWRRSAWAATLAAAVVGGCCYSASWLDPSIRPLRMQVECGAYAASDRISRPLAFVSSPPLTYGLSSSFGKATIASRRIETHGVLSARCFGPLSPPVPKSAVQMNARGHNAHGGKYSSSGPSNEPAPPLRPDQKDVIHRIIKECRTVRDVDDILRSLSSSSSSSSSSGIDEDDYLSDGRIAPEVAAAALRRTVDLRPDFEAWRRRRRWKKMSSDDQLDVEVARRVVPVLVENVGRAIVAATSSSTERRELRQDGVNDITQTTKSPSYFPLTSNATADTLYSLATLSEMESKRENKSARVRQRGGSGGVRPLANLLCTYAVSNDGAASFVNIRYWQLIEVLWALATLHLQDQSDLLDPIGNRLIRGDKLGLLKAHHLSTGLWAYASLDRPHVGVLKSFMRRLRKQNVSSTASGRDIARSVWAAGRSLERLDDVVSTQHPIEGMFDTPSTLLGTGEAGKPANFTHNGNMQGLDLQIAILRNEAETMFHTLAKTLRDPVPNPRRNRGGAVPRREEEPIRTKLQSLTSGQIADMFSACVDLEINNQEPVLADLCSQFSNKHVVSRCTLPDIARILWSQQRLQLRGQEDCVKLLGRRCLHLIRERKQGACDPKTLNTIIRSVVLLYRANSSVTNHFFVAAELLLTADCRGNDGKLENISRINGKSFSEEGTSFLSRCNEFEVSNFVWAMAMAGHFDQELLITLTDRMLEKDIVDSCSPSSASRVLWSYTILLSLNNAASDIDDSGSSNEDPMKSMLRERQFELFQKLGVILLSSQLTPADAHSAMWAMAKASYSLDVGIFDHLSEVLSCDDMLERSSVTNIAQALWACGKMVTFEDPLRDKIEFGVQVPPPYLKNANRFARFLVSLRDQMTAKDVAQSVWAIGRLKISNESILSPMALSAAEVAPTCNSQEVANMMWGLSKAGYDNATVVSTLTSRLTSPELLQSCSSQEAANAMYALGKMKIRDVDAFETLSVVMMNKLNDTTSQAISNVLWAHQVVKLAPPPALFDCWANQKLGIVGLYVNQGDKTANDIEVMVDDANR